MFIFGFLFSFRQMFFKKRESRPLDFLVIGAQKCGTTALYSYLKEHEEIGMSFKKEMHFFDDETLFSADKEIDYKAYESSIQVKTGKERIYGEITPIYLYWQNSCERIWRYNKNIKLIAILRNPIERAFSHWNMSRERGIEKHTFYEAILLEQQRQKESLPYQNRVFSYVDRGFYSEQIRRYRRFFDDDHILFIKYEDFKADQKEKLNSIFEFLNVDPSRYDYAHKIIHKREYESKITEKERQLLLDTFYYDIKEVERMLGWDCSDWLKKENG
ncbi:sulfotransferase domain-containing protein [Flavobacterium sp. NRK F10]|uniref:sulfotransferase domain-containing protein n=1 Tax=Flavobacterium sp. NRK F10 TaxID=2954931 RepID=UPI00209176E1|nr:sulfotransferase domain-containing protein [Flavobacterium sp. NRK F10]MCO6173809.1 sulfotransferase domain-containing protein [Flavobacterium sp. NRK F10]